MEIKFEKRNLFLILLTFEGMPGVWLVTLIASPASWNSKGSLRSKLPLHGKEIYRDKGRKKFFTYKIFDNRKDAERTHRKILAACADYFNKPRSHTSTPWLVDGGIIENFPDEDSALERVKNIVARSFRYRI